MSAARKLDAQRRYFNPAAADVLPQSLRERSQWITWALVPKGDGKPAKVPTDPQTSRSINGQDSAHWMSFPEAVAAFEANPRLAGIGYVLTPDDGVTGIDMDGCRDPDSGKVADWAMAHIRQFQSYSEISPSGTGIRILAAGKPEAGHPTANGQREIYSKARFLTITGDCMAARGELREAPEAVKQYLGMMRPEKTDTGQPDNAGDGSGMPHLIGENRNNTLTKEAGWLRRHGYSADEIEAALLKVNANRCRPPLDDSEVSSIAQSVAKYSPAADAFAEPDPITLPIVSLHGLADLHIDPVPEIVERILPATVVTILAAHGGTGKTMWALQLVSSVTAGLRFMGLNVTQCPATYYSAEDDTRILLIRLQRILKRYGIDPDDVADWLQIIDATSIDPALFREANVKDGTTTIRRGITTQAYQALIDACKANGSRLLIIDNASDVFEASENERQRVRQFVRSLSSIAREIDGAVLLLSHVDKNTAKSGGNSEGYSGSTAWHNSARSRLFLSSDGDQLLLEHQKANHGPRADDIPLSWSDGLLVPGHHADPEKVAADGLIEARNARTILQMIHERTERGHNISTSTTGGNAYAVLSPVKGFPPGMGRKPFWGLMDALESQGRLTREEYKTQDRKTKTRFRVTDAGLDLISAMEAGE